MRGIKGKYCAGLDGLLMLEIFDTSITDSREMHRFFVLTRV
jgi:hypothetical protein